MVLVVTKHCGTFVKHFETQYKIILFDYVGAGQSDLTAYNSSKYDCLQGYAQDVLEVIESMQLQKSFLLDIPLVR